MPHNLGYPKEVEVTQEGIRELIATWGPRDRRANRKGKTSILDEFVHCSLGSTIGFLWGDSRRRSW